MASNVQHERLVKIEDLIKSRRKITRAVLAEELEVDKRTIHRDLDFLRDRYGAPLEYTPQKGYHYTDPDWQMPDVRLSERDLFSLLIARQAVALYRGTPLTERLTRIFNKIAGSLSGKIDVHPDYPSQGILSFAPAPVLEVNETVWSRLLAAIRRRRSVRMTYASRNSEEIAERRVDPYHILNMQGDWYLYGWDHHRDRVSQFLLHRVRSVKHLRESFAVVDGFDIREITESSFGSFGSAEKMTNVRLVITGSMGKLLAGRQFHAKQRVKPVKEGFEIRFPVSSAGKRPFYNVIQWILSMGRDVQILAPAQLKTLVREEILAMQKIIEK